MAQDRGSFYRIRDLPAGVRDELRQAAGSVRLPINRAFQHLLLGVSLTEAILVGKRTEDRFADQGVATIGVHIPAELKAELARSAAVAGVDLRDAGRLIIIGRSGRLAETIKEGLSVQLADAATKAAG